MSAIEIPASSDDPPPSPSLWKNARPKSGNTLAIDERKRSFPASTDAAWCGYEIEMYIMIDWKVRKMPGR